MSFDDALETVVRVRPLGNDKYGDPIPGDPPRLDIEGCLVAPLRSTEPADRGRYGAVTGWSVFAPVGADVVHTDQVEIRGVLCDVIGEVAEWEGDPSGVVINAQRATG